MAGKHVLGKEIMEATKRGDLIALQRYLDEHPEAVWGRDVYQSNLLHTASRHGQTELVRELLERNHPPNLLDYGGMRRTALHWACQQGHVRIVELLVEAGADTRAQGKEWSQLVQGVKCGKMVDTESPCAASAVSLCSNSAVRLALERTPWSPANHHQFPQQFKDAVSIFMLAAHNSLPSPSQGDAQDCDMERPRTAQVPLNKDELYIIFGLMSYPISDWVGDSIQKDGARQGPSTS
eukprot:jgi/Botrbrau1/14629/Bobra.0364s0013.1